MFIRLHLPTDCFMKNSLQYEAAILVIPQQIWIIWYFQIKVHYLINIIWMHIRTYMAQKHVKFNCVPLCGLCIDMNIVTVGKQGDIHPIGHYIGNAKSNCITWHALCGFHYALTLGGDKVSMLRNAYPHKALRRNKVTMCNHQADSPLYVWPGVWSVDLQVLKKSIVIHDTECPHWYQVSVNNTNSMHWNLSLGLTDGRRARDRLVWVMTM